MKNFDFDWQINEFMIYCRSTQLRERTMYSYEQTLRLFERWLCDELKIYSVALSIQDKYWSLIPARSHTSACFKPSSFLRRAMRFPISE